MVANIIQYVAPLKEYVPYYGVFSRATNIYSLAPNPTMATASLGIVGELYKKCL